MIASFKNIKWIFAALIGAFSGIILIFSTAQSGVIHNTSGKVLTSIKALNGSSPILTVEPLTSTVIVGEVFTVDVVIQDVNDLYGIQIAISFDYSRVQVIDADAITTGVQITPGSCPTPDFIVQNTVSNTTGTVEFTATSLNPTLPCDGNGVIATIQFQAIAQGGSSIHFTDWILADPNGASIPTITQDGNISVDGLTKLYLPIVYK